MRPLYPLFLRFILYACLFEVSTTVNAQKLEWARSFGSNDSDEGQAISVDASGNVYSTGFFKGTVDFDPGEGTTYLTSVGDADIFVQKMDPLGNFLWARSFGGLYLDEGLAITVDALGNVFTTGRFSGIVDFDPGEETTDLISAGGGDIFVQKMDASGNFLWARSFGGTSIDKDEGHSISVDASGSVYTTGYFSGRVDFDPGPGTNELISVRSGDIFVQKLDASGNFLWAKSFGGDYLDIGQGISIDVSGNVFTTGRFRGTIDFDPGPGTSELTSVGFDDIFIQKLDASGNFLWAKSFGGDGYDVGHGISIDVTGNLYTTGYFHETVDFDPGEGVTELSSVGNWDIFVQKLDASGNFLWAKSFGGDGYDVGYAIGVDASGNVYTTGYFRGTVDFDPGARKTNLTSAGDDDIFIQKLDASGNFLWAKHFGSDDFDWGQDISVDVSGNIYTIGYFRGTVDFDPGIGTTNLTPIGVRDIFVLKLNPGIMNNDPVLSNALLDQTTTVGEPFSFTFPENTFSDADGNDLTFIGTLEDGSVLPRWLVFDASIRTFSGTPTSNDTGIISIKVIADDGKGGMAEDIFSLTVQDIPNTSPVLVNTLSDQTATLDEAFSFTFPENTFSDADGDILTFTSTLEDGSVLPKWLAFDAAIHTFSGTPTSNDLGTIIVKITADDGKGGMVDDVFAITVNAEANTAPRVLNTLPDQTAPEGDAFTFTFPENTFDDADGDVLTYRATLKDGSALPRWLVFDGATRTFSGTPTSNDRGSSDIKVTAGDEKGGMTEDIFILTVEAVVHTVSFEWAKSFGGNDFAEGRSISTDVSGSVYTTGYFSGTVDFGPGPGTTVLTSVGDSDIFIQKLDSSGNFLWVKSFGDIGREVGNSINIDSSGNVYTTGYFSGTVDFDPGPGTSDRTSAGDADIFIQKLDASGNFLWARSFGSDSFDEGIAISVDASGNVYITGRFSGTVDFDPSTRTSELTSFGSGDIFVQKLDASGNFLWVRSFGSDDIDLVEAISVDASGNVYTTGVFKGTVDFDPGPGTSELISLGSGDIFIQKLDTSGDFLWARSFGSDGNDEGNCIDVDASGNIYTTGYFQGTVDFDPGEGSTELISVGKWEIFVQKLDASGNFLWARSFGSDGHDVGNSISMDASGNLYTTGIFQKTVDFDPSPRTSERTSVGDWDIFVQVMDASGNFLWAESFGSGGSDQGLAISVDVFDNVYTTGFFRGTVDFDPGPGTIDVTTDGFKDIFVLKLDPEIMNTIPVLTNTLSDQTTSLDKAFSFTFSELTFKDANGDPLTYRATLENGSALPRWLVFNATTRTFSGTPTNNDIGSISIKVTASDGNGGTAEDTFSITVNAEANTAPAVLKTLSDQIVTEGYAFTFTLPENTFSDVDGDALAYRAMLKNGSALPRWLFFDSVTQMFSGTPTSNDRGSISIKVTAEDGKGGMAEEIFKLTVEAVIDSPNFEWARSFGSTRNDQGDAISVDALGNVYTTGYFQGTVDFDPGVGITELTSVGGSDIFIQKMDSSGNFLWARSFGSDGNDGGNAISIDASGNIYTTGRFRGTVDFDPGAGVTNLTSVGDGDIFIMKLDSSGNFLWTRSCGGYDYDVGRAISIDASGNVYTTGSFQRTVDFDPGAGVTNLTSVGNDDIFIQKLDASGNFLWARSFGSNNLDFSSSISIDASGNVYTAGHFRGTVDFDPGPETTNLTSVGDGDIFIQKLDASGDFLWARPFGGDGYDVGRAIGVDALGNVYTTGFFTGTVDFDPGSGTSELTSVGSGDIFIQKLDASGDFLWARSFGSYHSDWGDAINLDASGNIYTTGYFQGTVDFDPGADTTYIVGSNAPSFGDIFIQKLDPLGNFLWARSFGDRLIDWGQGISVDASGNIYTTGSFNLTVDFDPGPGTTNLTSVGNGDTFVLKMSPGIMNSAPVLTNALSDQIAIEGEAFSFTFPENTFSDPDGDLLTYMATLEDGTALPAWLIFDADTRTFSGMPTSNALGSISIKVAVNDGNRGMVEDIFTLTIENALNTPNIEWARSFGSEGSVDTGNAVSVDVSGNVYTTGSFSGTVDFDPGPGTTNLTSVGGAGGFDIFVQKSDASGNFLWARSFGGIRNDNGRAISVDILGNVYISGRFSETVDFDPGPGVTELTSVELSDIFVQKLDASGNFLWARSFGGEAFDEGHSISVDDFGNVYTTGRFSGTVDFDSGEGIHELTSAGDNDIFIQKLDASGNFLWARSFGGDGIDIGHSISIDGLGNVYTTGYFYRTVDFDPGEGVANLISAGFTDIFIQKLDASGNFLWARSFGGDDFDTGQSISVDGLGNVYTTGNFFGKADFDPGAGVTNLTSEGEGDIFVQKLDSSGNFLWAKSFGSNGFDTGTGISVDDFGNVYTTGYFAGTVDFDPGERINNHTSAGSFDIFVQKLDNSGNFLWIRSFGGDGTDVGHSIGIDGLSNVYTTGYFYRTVDFELESGTTELTSVGQGDVFVLKLDPGNKNTAPNIENALSEQTVTEGETFTFTFPENTFSDVDGDTLTYVATLEDGSALPLWLSFDANTNTFSGTPNTGDEGTVTIKVTARDGKGGTAEETFTITVEAPLSLEDEILKQATSIYPNHNQGRFIVELANDYTGRVTLQLMDITGKVHFETVLMKNTSRIEYPVTQDNLAEGMYLLRIVTDGAQATKRLIINY